MSRCWKTRIFRNKYRVKRRTRGLARNCCECRGCLTYAEEQRRKECLPHKLSILNMLNERKWRMWGAAENIRWLIWPHPQRVARLTAIRHALLIVATIQSRHDMRGERLIIRVSLLFGVGWVWIGIVSPMKEYEEKITTKRVIFPEKLCQPAQLTPIAGVIWRKLKFIDKVLLFSYVKRCETQNPAT